MTVRRAPQLQRPLTVLLYGDKPMANRWLPWAKKKLHTLERYHVGFNGKSFGAMAYRPVAKGGQSVRVLIKAAKEQKWIIIWADVSLGLYMESGLLDHRNIALLNEGTYLPSVLHYGTAINAIRGDFAALGELIIKEAQPNLLQGENRGEGDSFAVGCKKPDKVKELTVSSSFGSATFEANKAIYCDDPAVALRKKIQVNLPPSKWSGKMRLFVQALYGTNREDYAMDPVLEDLGPLKINNADLNWNYNGGTALFSGRNYEYFLLSVSDTGLWARPMATGAAGRKLRKYLNDNPGVPADRKLQYETYLLSTLYVDSESQWVQVTGNTGDAFKRGSPIYYGWSWNWEGTEARAVTIQLKPGTDNVWQTTMFRLSVVERDLAETLEDGRLNAVFGTEEETQDVTFRDDADLIWYPYELGGGMQIFKVQPDAFSSPSFIDCDVPVYIVANYASDDFDVVRFKREDLGSGAIFGGGLTGTSDTIAPRCGTYACDYYSDGTDGLEVGFYIDGYTDFTAVDKSGSSLTFSGNEAWISEPNINKGEDPSPSTGPLNVCDGDEGVDPDGLNSSYIEFHSSSFGTMVVLTNGDLSTDSLVAIPYFDCDSIYIGKRWRFSGDIEWGHTQSGSTVRSGYEIYDSGVLVSDGVNRSLVTWFVNDGSDIVGSAQNQGKWVSDSQTGKGFDSVDVRYFSNGSDTEAYKKKEATDATVTGMIIPSCMQANVSQFTDVDDTESWEVGSGDSGGFEFDPVLYPEAEIALPVVSRTSANHLSYRATKNPSETTIESGGYDWDLDNISGSHSFVGFA